MQIAIVKYNAGNIRSVVNALQRIGCNPVITDSPEVLQSADKIIFPGQGAAGETMKYLKEHNLDRLIRALRQPWNMYRATAYVPTFGRGQYRLSWNISCRCEAVYTD